MGHTRKGYTSPRLDQRRRRRTVHLAEKRQPYQHDRSDSSAPAHGRGTHYATDCQHNLSVPAVEGPHHRHVKGQTTNLNADGKFRDHASRVGANHRGTQDLPPRVLEHGDLGESLRDTLALATVHLCHLALAAAAATAIPGSRKQKVENKTAHQSVRSKALWHESVHPCHEITPASLLGGVRTYRVFESLDSHKFQLRSSRSTPDQQRQGRSRTGRTTTGRSLLALTVRAG